MDLSGLRETISTREKIFPERSRMVGSVNGKSIMVPRIGPLGRGANRANRIIKSTAKGKGAAERLRAIRLAASGQFQLQKGLISETMQKTAEERVSGLGGPGFPD